MCGQAPKKWTQWLSMAQWWYNSSHHSAIHMSPFQALFGYTPPSVTMGNMQEARVIGVEQLLSQREEIMVKVKQNLELAKQRMKYFADKHRSERVFERGDWVYLKLRPYKQFSVRSSQVWKLSPRNAGPFMILEKVGEVAYKLDLPDSSKIHPVFHVSLLKKHAGPIHSVTSTLPTMDEDGAVLLVPVKLLARRMIKRHNAAVVQVLIQWEHLPKEEATWEDYSVMTQKFPNLDAIDACGQASSDGGRNVMGGSSILSLFSKICKKN